MWYDLFIPVARGVRSTMGSAVKKTISLPPDLAREAEEIAKAEGKTLSAVVQDALRQRRTSRLKRELESLQDYWSRQARDKGILTEEDLERYLEQ
jgi:predicted transcriptional regulator